MHGWTADRHRWDHQTAHFSAHRRVIRLDLRGHGESTGAGAPTLDALARDVVALLDHLGVGRFAPVGHSMGGMTAQTLALTHPGRVERLVLVNCIGRMTYSRARGLLMAASTLAPFKLFVAADIRRAFGPGHPRRGREVHPRLRGHAPRGGHDPVRGDARLRRPRPGRRDPRADPDGARLPRRPAARTADAAPRQGIPRRRDPRPGRRARTAPGAARRPHRRPHRRPAPLPRPPVAHAPRTVTLRGAPVAARADRGHHGPVRAPPRPGP
ncbi:alpha/beta fold hydrolase [Streptomyces pseudogriseolus]|uniref:alpha/beta fold hydrolase n=1 Tax=Streptomyces pseudogriseolus TaxID=36817 RepID=UPI003FA2094B